ncbi:MxaK protein [Piscinibacter sakaiensis]|uniref:MxaK protein n=1 Tax=Piscinibacter sakaiensis TaxID=1547922 RepID=UPI00372D1269
MLALGSWDAWRWQQARASNARIEADRPDPGLAGDPAQWPPPQRFTHARQLAAAGELEAALKLYRPLQGDSPLGQRARYNVAHLLLLQAEEVRAGPQPGQALPLIELAKEIYRELLRLDPGDWDARYNLERAQRLLPDPPDEEDSPGEPPQQSERAATTMRGVSPGLP